MMAVSAQEAKARVWALRFEDFFQREYATIYRAAFLATGSREVAQDVTQEAFARAYARWRRLRNKPWAGGWVMTTAVNLCKRHKVETISDSQSERPERPAHHPHEDVRLDLTRALQQLPPRQRVATILFYVGDLPLSEIAHVMQISEGTVKAHLAQARRRLKVLMEASYG